MPYDKGNHSYWLSLWLLGYRIIYISFNCLYCPLRQLTSDLDHVQVWWEHNFTCCFPQSICDTRRSSVLPSAETNVKGYVELIATVHIFTRDKP